jgi:hypothetical protein
LKQRTDEDNAKETSYVPKEKEYIWSTYKKFTELHVATQ